MNLEKFKWLNPSKAKVENNTVDIFAPGGTDFFNTPVTEDEQTSEFQTNAPFLYQEVEGNFVLKALLVPTHETLYDAAGLMVFQSPQLWAKVGYEKTKPDVRRLLSVVTNPISDDANGPILNTPSVWIQIARKGQSLAIHYSIDGEKYDMLRVCAFLFPKNIKVGLFAQCPTGKGIVHSFRNIQLEKRSIGDIWTGL